MRGIRPRVLMISARSDIGGGPAHMFTLAQGLTDQANIYAAMPDDGEFFEGFVKLLALDHVFVIPRQKLTLDALFGLGNFCKKNKIDLIHSHGKGAGLYSRMLGLIIGVPVVHTLHGYHDGRYTPSLKHLYALWETLAALVTQKIICVSASESALFKRKVLVSQAKLVVIPNGTGLQLSEISVSKPKKVVTVARFDYQKNLLEFLRVAQQLPGYEFFVIGDGVDRSEIEAYIHANNIKNVSLCGASQTVLADIADADLYVTTARWEGLPLAVLEAMSLGIPVVASDVVGNRDAVEPGVTGYLYPLGDISACVAAMAQATLLDRVQIRKFHCENFSSECMITKTLGVYKNVLEGRAAR